MKGFFNSSEAIYKHEKENGLLPQPAKVTKKKADTNTEMDEPTEPTEPTKPAEPTEPTEPVKPTEPVDEPTD